MAGMRQGEAKLLQQPTHMQVQMKGWRAVPLTSIQHQTGFAYLAVTRRPDYSSHKRPSPACVLENGVPLPGPRNAPHDDIRKLGEGRYSFWHDYVYLSTSDNSDPRANGRHYEISCPPITIRSVVTRLFDIAASPLGVYRCFRWLRLVLQWFSKLPKTFPDTFWTMVYWSLFAWVRRQERWKLKNRKPGVLSLASSESLSNNVSTSPPVNLQARRVSEDSLLRDVQYAAQIGQSYIRSLPQDHKNLHGKIVLELGPGVNFGSTLILACNGAKVMVVDRFLTPWDERYHPRFYSLLKDWIHRNMPEADLTPIEIILSNSAYREESILCYSSPLEDLSGIPNVSVDVVFSNAVLEHLYDPFAAFHNLARISKPDALGIHQVDFRYHKMMDKPLEFLFLKETEFSKEFKECHGECGNRYRPYEYSDLFEKAGFQVKFEPSLYAEDAYLKEFLPRLRSADGSRYQNRGLADLRIISGLFTVVRKSHA